MFLTAFGMPLVQADISRHASGIWLPFEREGESSGRPLKIKHVVNKRRTRTMRVLWKEFSAQV